MEINYLNLLKDTSKGSLTNKALPLFKIEELENSYNNGAVFPKCLRELLSIAGEYCVVLDYSLCESQQEMQDYANELLADGNLHINRPFYAIDFYSDGSQFSYVYLDENTDDPFVNVAYVRTTPGIENLYNINKKLSDFLNSRAIIVRDGFNPF